MLIRRWVPAKFTGWSAWDLRWELQLLSRLIRRDHRWCVELYDDVHDDPGGVPAEAPARRWILPDRRAAIEFAESVSDQVVSRGLEAELPDP